MKATIQPSALRGRLQAPASKSSMQRACAAALVARGTSLIHNPGHSNDDRAALGIIQALGASVETQDGRLLVKSPGVPFHPGHSPLEVSCGESGLGVRMFTPLVALSDAEILLKGEGSLVSRPMDFFDSVLPRLGVTIRSNQGRLPLSVRGMLQPADIEIDGSLSSQFLTGLLLAYAAADARGVCIRVRNLKSRPYIDLTLDVMRRFGLKVPENQGYERFCFDAAPHPAGEGRHEYTVEGDWSGGAFLLVAGVLAGDMTVHGLDMGSTQADKAIVEALMAAGAGIAIEAKGIRLHRAPMKGFTFDATDCPDLFPPLVALAAYCQGDTVLRGAERLTHKESNRALTLQEEFRKLGLPIELAGDTMVVHGGHPLRGAAVHSRHDHRIAMACAVAALGAQGETVIEQAEAVSKSYPDFYRDLQQAGASISLTNSFVFHE